MNYITSKRSLENLSTSRHGRSVEVFEPTKSDVVDFLEKFLHDVADAASMEAVLRVFQYNPETVIAFRNIVSRETGFVALLPLNPAGHIALADDRLSTTAPQLEYICKAEKTPHSIYVWGIGISHRTSGGIAHVKDVLERPNYANRTLYCKAANAKAERLFLSLGFTRGAMMDGSWRPDLMEYRRPTEDQHPVTAGMADEKRPLYDSFDPQTALSGAIGIKLVHSSQELLQVFMIRGAAYLGEQGIPWTEDVDGNDYCAAHLIGYVGSEPASCLRVRFFAGFVKLERLAVLPQFRTTSVATRTVRAAIEYARTKGYTRFYGQTERNVFPIWQRFGFNLRPQKGVRYQTEREYVEGDMITKPAKNPINPCSGAHVLLRPEGQWHRKGVLEVCVMSHEVRIDERVAENDFKK